MGHGGHGGMSMDDMVRAMRNRFLVALVLTAGITSGPLWAATCSVSRHPRLSVFAMTCSP